MKHRERTSLVQGSVIRCEIHLRAQICNPVSLLERVGLRFWACYCTGSRDLEAIVTNAKRAFYFVLFNL